MTVPREEDDTDFGPLKDSRRGILDPNDFYRLERKVDKMIDSLNQMAILANNHSNLEKDFLELKAKTALLESQILRLERKVDQWINRGIGVWAVVIVLFAAFQTWYPGHGK